MITRYCVSTIVAAALLATLALLVPQLVGAQSATSSAELRAAIQTAILSDPRSASLPPEKLNAMVDLLTAQAQTRGLTAQDVAYRAGEQTTKTLQEPTCDSILCSMSEAFGFSGQHAVLLLLTLLVSGILILVIGNKLREHHQAQNVQ